MSAPRFRLIECAADRPPLRYVSTPWLILWLLEVMYVFALLGLFW
jgi:hypothetical protein